MEFFKNAQNFLNKGIYALNDLIGALDASDTIAESKRAQFRLLPSAPPSKKEKPAANATGKRNKESTGALSFSLKEIEEMPKELKQLFISGAIIAHVRHHLNEYEIRVQIKGKRINACGQKLSIAKIRFIQKLKEYERLQELANIPTAIFSEYSEKWLETRDPNIKPRTHEDYVSQLNDLNRVFGKKDLRDIGQFEIMEYLNGLVGEEKARAARKRYQILSSIFDYAVIDDIIRHSPMSKVKIPVYEGETGKALTRDEENSLIKKCLAGDTQSGAGFIFLLYTGLRRSELATAEIIDGVWIKVITAKQRVGKKEKPRLIPISPRLKKLLPNLNLDTIKNLYPNRLSRTFKEWCPNHHLHET